MRNPKRININGVLYEEIKPLNESTVTSFALRGTRGDFKHQLDKKTYVKYKDMSDVRSDSYLDLDTNFKLHGNGRNTVIVGKGFRMYLTYASSKELGLPETSDNYWDYCYEDNLSPEEFEISCEGRDMRDYNPEKGFPLECSWIVCDIRGMGKYVVDLADAQGDELMYFKEYSAGVLSNLDYYMDSENVNSVSDIDYKAKQVLKAFGFEKCK